MNTLLLAPEIFRNDGGIARILRLYLQALCETAAPGDMVDCLVLNDTPEVDHRLGFHTSPAFRSYIGCNRSRARFVRQALQLSSAADRIVCGHVRQLVLPWLSSRLGRPRPYHLIAHGIDVWRPFSLLESLSLRGATRILCVSEFTRCQLLRFAPQLDPGRLAVLPNALDPRLGEASPGSENPACPTAPSAGRPGGPTILAVSRLTSSDAYKGIDTLIEALPGVRAELPGARLRIVGDGDDRARLEQLALCNGLGAAVSFAGRVDDEALSLEYRACDVFALPSRREGFGIVFLEAMTHGKACVGARAGGIPEVVDEAVGALSDYGDIAGLSAALLDLLLHPRDPQVIRRHADRYSYDVFRHRVAEAIAE